MFYPNRQALGDQLAPKLSDFKNSDCIIFCLKKSSLLACIELAAHLHAYIYILQYSEIADPYDITRNLGAITSKGEFVLTPLSRSVSARHSRGLMPNVTQIQTSISPHLIAARLSFSQTS